MSIAWLFWALAAVSLAIYLYMVFGPLRRIRKAAGGPQPSEVRTASRTTVAKFIPAASNLAIVLGAVL